MEYLASEIIERAKNLADIGNTNYISHKEAIQYLNDAYSYVYQLSINRGDNFFVKRVNLGTGVNILPRDFYQLRSIKNPFSGYLYTRKPLNSSINEPGYEILNGKINISGINSQCEMTYYPEPKLLTFPNETKQLEMPIPNSIFSLFGNNLIYKNEDMIYRYDITTGENVAIDYDIDHLRKIYTSNNYFVAIKTTGIDFIDFDGNKFRNIKTEDAFIVFRKQNGEIDILTELDINYRGKVTTILDTDYVQASSEALYYISDGILYKQLFEDDPIEIDAADSFYVNKKFGRDYITYELHGELFVYINEDIWDLDVDYKNLIGYTDFYVIATDGVVTTAYSNEPDIILNYPDNTYYSLLAYQLALNFVAKQGGDPTILSSQFDKAKFDFENNAQDAFTSVRIKNVYR